MFSSKDERQAKKAEAEAQKQRDAEDAAAQLEERRAQRNREIEDFRATYRHEVTESVQMRGRAHLYWEAYVPVDAQMNSFEAPSGLDLKVVNEYGRRGWEVVSVIPRTYGGYQSYSVSKTTAYGVSGWGKDTHQVGLGGHIVGVYLLLHFEVTAENLVHAHDAIEHACYWNTPDELRVPVS